MAEIIFEKNKTYLGDCLELIKQVPDGSIDLIITSPPYNIGKDYGEYDDNLETEQYHKWLSDICAELYRVIKPNGNIFINICDVGVSNKDAKGKHKIGERGNFYVIPHHIVVIDAMIKNGAQYSNPIIWKKPSNHKSQFGANARFCGTYPYPANCHIPSEIEYVLRFRKNGKFQKVDKNIKEKSKVTKERWMELSSQIWEFNGVSKMKNHPAQFPVELPKRCIEGWSFIGDTVLDPFMGLGTTAIACIEMSRNYIGFELSENFLNLSLKREENFLKSFSPQTLFGDEM